ncbi:MAG: helix-turn-helix transcriptional regulator, partial [Treponema sp.]|nr:helix-turn-helix transcriptional regulator [Treponema sp.]
GTYLEQYMQEAQNKVDSIISILSKQERNIFEALLQDKSNKQICDEFFLSSRTVENYTSRLYAKIGVKNREELIAKYR